MNRNEFLRLSGVGITGLAGLGAVNNLSAASPKKERKDDKFKLGLASYTFRKFNIDDTLKWAKQLDLKGISIKDMHMPLNSSPEDLRKITEKAKAAGITPYGAGVIYMKSAKDVTDAFQYAVNAGIQMITGAPNHEFLPLVNEQVKQYNIMLAIHNHGPGDSLYHSPIDVYDKVKDLDKRIGLCIDVGHVQRIGQDPAEMIVKFKDRLYDMHMKDVNKNTGDGVPVEMGHGIIDIPKVVKALRKANYAGYVSFEYEKDGDAPLSGLAESVGYFRAVMKMT